MEDFVKEKVLSIERTYSHAGVFIVTLKPEYRFNSEAAPHKMSFGSKPDALSMIRDAYKVEA